MDTSLPEPENPEVLRHLTEFKQLRNLKDQIADDQIRSIMDKLLSIIQALEHSESRQVVRLDKYRESLVGGRDKEGELDHGYIQDLRHVKIVRSYIDTSEDIMLSHNQETGSFYVAFIDILKVIKHESAKGN